MNERDSHKKRRLNIVITQLSRKRSYNIAASQLTRTSLEVLHNTVFAFKIFTTQTTTKLFVI